MPLSAALASAGPALARMAAKSPSRCAAARSTRSLPRRRVIKPDGEEWDFEIDAFRKDCLVNGWDEIGLTLRPADEIRAFESQRRLQQPWLFG